MRRSWYRKVALELILNTSVVNAHILYKDATNRKISIIEYRKELALHLTSCREINISSSNVETTNIHELLKKEGSVRRTRRYCTECYKINMKFGRSRAKNKTKHVATYCNGCVGQPHMCVDCFNSIHKVFRKL